MKTSRSLVLELLLRMESDSAFSNILLDDALSKSGLDLQERKFAAALFYGVLERKLTLDAVIKKYSSKPTDKLSDRVIQALRMGIYQLLYMNSVPDSAAVNESVLLLKDNKNTAVGGFVNAVLRSFIRDEKRLPEAKGKIQKLLMEYSAPEWLILKWIEEYGEKNALSMLEYSLGRPPVTIRANTVKAPIYEIIELLQEDGIKAEVNDIFECCLEIRYGGAIEKSSAYASGYFHVQDISSQLCCQLLDAKEGEIVLDLCAAPGGKSFTIAEIMNNNGQLFAYDLHMKRVGLIAQGAKRLGLKIIKSKVNDAKKFSEEIPLADKILCDVPCSGLGVIRRKPEIKYKNPNDFGGLPAVQYAILETAARYLKVGGELVYSTCTLSRAENDEVIDKFLANHEEFEGVDMKFPKEKVEAGYKATIFPDDYNSDGFFISKIRKTR